MTQPTLQQKYDSDRARHDKLMSEEADRFHKAFVTDPLSKRTMKEGYFREYFLPRLLGEIDHPEWRTEWLMFSGTYASPVYVIDDYTGEHLFKVPALLQTTGLNPVNKDNAQIDQICREYEARSGSLTGNAQFHFTNGIENAYKHLFENYSLKSDMLAWRDILIRYGRLVAKENKTIDDKEVDQSSEVEFDYD